MATTGHTVKAFDQDLGQIRALVSEMGGRAETAIAESILALTRRDNALAARVVEGDQRIDELELEIEQNVVRLIALRAPMADDLREVLAAMKIASVVERIGDYAKNIAKRVPLLHDAGAIEPISIVPAMASAACAMVHDVLDAFVARNAEMALDVVDRDQVVDGFYNSLFRTLLTYMMENPHTITPATHILFIAKNLERIGDHATNVAEMVYFAATGKQMVERQRGVDALAPGAN
jgi:phosphate transport system protein